MPIYILLTKHNTPFEVNQLGAETSYVGSPPQLWLLLGARALALTTAM